jgi:proteasome accessory factor B
VLIRPGRAAGVRRWAEDVTPGPTGDTAVLSYSEPEGLAHWLVSYGADVTVLDPPEVREAAIARLRALAAGPVPPRQGAPDAVRVGDAPARVA